jgi:hypothetical protein
MWMYSGSSYPDCPISEDLGDMEVNTRICRVHADGTIQNLSTSPAPLREGVDNPWVSPFGPTFGYLCQFWLLNAFMLLGRVLGVFASPSGGSPYLRTWRDGKRTVPTMNGCRHRDRGGGHGALPGRWRGRGGRTHPPSLNPWQGTMKMGK